MADLLGATNPVPGYDSSAINRQIPISPNDLQIKNIVDPTRVVRSDGRNEQQDAGDATHTPLPRFDSNFQTFLQRLRETPDLAGELSRIFLSRQGTVVTSGLGEGIAAEMGKLLDMLKMNQGEFVDFLSNQLQSATRFSGALFNVLREAYYGSQSEGMREDVLLFLKKYSDFSSTAHIEKNLMRSLGDMAKAMPSSWSGKLLELAAKLQNGVAAGDRQGNLELLRNEVIPYMSEYVDRTHDLGRPRTLLSMLSLDMTRYENGAQESVVESFHRLLGYNALRERLGGIEDKILLRLLRGTDFAKAAEENQFADQLAAAAGKALRGEGDAETQEGFKEVVRALLVHESVYMPVNHVLIPMEWNGRLMFSEMWVDPDADNAQERRGGGDGENTLRFLFKLDIQNTGLFDVVLSSHQGKVDLEVNCPEKVAPFADIISKDLADILSENGLTAQQVSVGKLERSRALSEVFPKIFEGKNSVNVKV